MAKADQKALHEEIRTFAAEHPDGWGHDGWNGFLRRLEGCGIDTRDAEGIGRELEKERLRVVLERRSIPGLGVKRIDALVDRFVMLWNLRQASVEDVARLRTIPRPLAERIKMELH